MTPLGLSTNQIIESIILDLACTPSVLPFPREREHRRSAGKVTIWGEDRIFSRCSRLHRRLPGLLPCQSKTHTASAPCTLCSFKRYVVPQTRAAKFGYTVTVNANNSSALRCGDGQGALREGGIDDKTARTLGMTNTSIVNDGNCPLLALEREMKKHRGLETRNSQNEMIVHQSLMLIAEISL